MGERGTILDMWCLSIVNGQLLSSDVFQSPAITIHWSAMDKPRKQNIDVNQNEFQTVAVKQVVKHILVSKPRFRYQ